MKLKRSQQKLIVSLAAVLIVTVAGYFGFYPGSQSQDKSQGQTQRTTATQSSSSAGKAAVVLPAQTVVSAKVASVVDGDTAHFTIEGADVKVRFIGMNCPEDTTKVEKYGPEATAYTKSILTVGRQVWLETDKGPTDRYGRTLAYVWLTRPPATLSERQALASDALVARMLDAQLLAKGWAQVMTVAPNAAYKATFEELERQAKFQRIGMWR